MSSSGASTNHVHGPKLAGVLEKGLSNVRSIRSKSREEGDKETMSSYHSIIRKYDALPTNEESGDFIRSEDPT